MNVILTEDVLGLGDIGQQVKVRPGYARNFLIPHGKAVELGSSSARATKHKLEGIEAKKRRLKQGAEDLAAKLRNLSIEFSIRVSQSGKAFGAITARDVAERLAQAGFETDRRRIVLSDALKKEGVHFVKVKLHPEVDVQLKVQINASATTSADEKAELLEESARLGISD